jgi:hypothetical protein
MSLAEARYCALRERCKLYNPETGKSQKLGRYHKSTICDRCRAAGYTPGDAPALASNALPDKVPSADQRRECEFCGKPAVAGYRDWKPLVTGASDIDYDPGDVYFCEEHWERLHEAESITGFSSAVSAADEPFRPPEEVFGEVFKAAKALFEENVTEEDLIIPTLAFANQASALSELKAIRERFAEIADNRSRREQFANDFEQRFRGLVPTNLSDDVLILKSIRLSSDVSRYPGTTILKEVKIDVFMRSVKLEEVERLYKQMLEQESVRYDESSEGFCGYRLSDTHVSIVVLPCQEELDSDRVALLSSWGRQLTFPPPELVRKLYASLKGSVYRGKVWGVSHILGGRQSGKTAQADNLIPACVAWYLRERGGIADDHRLATLLNRELLAKCQKPEVGVKSGEAIWKSIDKVGDSIKRVEFTLQKGL